jgi:hypothetical protein
LLASGQLRGKMVEPMVEADHGERLLGRHRAFDDVGDERDVFARGQAGNEVVELKDEADVRAAVLGQFGLGGGGEIVILVNDLTRRRDIEPAEDVQQR